MPHSAAGPLKAFRLKEAALLLASTALCTAFGARAADAACATSFCWNVTSGIWSVGTNWTPGGGPPASTNTVTISNGGTANVDATNAQSSNATIDSNSAVVVQSGGSWSNAGSSPGFNEEGGAIVVGATGTGGTLTIDNGGTVTTTGANGAHVGTVLIGDQAGSSGTVTLGNGGAGTALLTSTAVDGSNFYVGYGGSGTLNVNAGGSISGFNGMELGALAGSSGTVTVNAGSLAAGGFMTVGGGGTGALTIENGGTVTATSATIASVAGADGSSATVTGAHSTWTLTGDLTVGPSGNGSLTIADGGAVNVASQFYLGDGAGAGTATVNGGTLTGGEALIGSVGSGASSLLIENGGVVSTPGPTFIGNTFGGTSTGTVTVTGAGSSWSIGSGAFDYLEIENAGTLTGLTVEDGASLTTGETLIGGYVSSAGNNAVVVSGAGTTWQSGVILLGDVTNAGAGSGTGTLSISAGAQVTASGNIDIGYSPDGGGATTDSITVDGSGSKLTSTANIRVGYYGTGALTIANGAQVSDVEGDIAYSSTNSTAAAAQFSGGSTTPTNSVGSVVVTGAGSLWQNTLLIVGDNTASPGAGYGTGTSRGTLTVSDGGQVASTDAIIVGASAGATGTINIGAAAGQAAVAPGTISAPAIDFSIGGGTLVFNHTSNDYVFSTQIEGAGSLDVENGTTVLTATNTYTGATTINGGTLEVNGAITGSSGVVVNSGGTLAGDGIVDPATVTIASGGTLAPGLPGAPGTSLTIAGNLAFQSGALYLIYLDPSNATMANVTGTAALAGTVQAVFANGAYVSKNYDILHSAGLGGTTFSGLTVTPPGFDASLSYSATDVYLDLTAILGSAGGLNPNQQSVASAINAYFNNGGTLPPQFLSLFSQSGGSLGNALTQLDGEDATGAEHGAFNLMNEFLTLLLDPSGYGGGTGFGGGGALGFAPDREASLPPDIALAYADVFKAPPKAQSNAQRWTTWASGFGGGATTNGDPVVGSSNLNTTTYGYAAGMDYHYSPDTTVGIALAGGGTNWDLANALGTGRSDAFLAGIHGVTRDGPAYAAAALAFANNWFTTNRIALGDQLTANFEGQSYAARLEGGYRFAVPSARNAAGVTPYAAIQVQSFHTPSYSETDLSGGGLGLSYNAMNGTDTRSELGGRVDDLTAISDMPLVLRAKLAWAHDWVSNPALNASFESLPGSSFTVDGAPIPENSALTSAGAQLFFTPNWSFLARFDGEFASGSQLYAGTGTLKYTW